ncbi:pirin family protein [Alloacidobacterium dinghuense]|uniref:Pirin family protein n=1 Tax=Alloacidobacterium dinghuense TaxID=2763107 RepID=A0A7G8BGH3_9BACT|nr:pirin family protein [Alloacidobacterium dinghuense]QNI31643.1 pirin family protein [Alloacidobacterium dinghuense]
MVELKALEDIAGRENGWLKAKHHFAIGEYGNSAHAPIGNLYVFNDDEIAPHSGFGLHHHANVEIITYVRYGTVTHQDDQGNRSQIEAGNVQVMSAGTGILHSETNIEDVPARLFQIWLSPKDQGGSPQWSTKPFPKADRAGRFVTFASGRTTDEEVLSMRADAEVSGALLERGSVTEYPLGSGDAAYLVPASGRVNVNGVRVEAREGLVIREEQALRIEAQLDAEVVLIVTRDKHA